LLLEQSVVSPGQVNRSHAAASDFPQDLVPTQMPSFKSSRIRTQVLGRRVRPVKKRHRALVSIEHPLHFTSQILIRMRGFADELDPICRLLFEGRFKQIPYLAKPFGCHFFILYTDQRAQSLKQLIHTTMHVRTLCGMAAFGNRKGAQESRAADDSELVVDSRWYSWIALGSGAFRSFG
jgi:hypothetical protein